MLMLLKNEENTVNKEQEDDSLLEEASLNNVGANPYDDDSVELLNDKA
jgi:hypothetical protein